MRNSWLGLSVYTASHLYNRAYSISPRCSPLAPSPQSPYLLRILRCVSYSSTSSSHCIFIPEFSIRQADWWYTQQCFRDTYHINTPREPTSTSPPLRPVVCSGHEGIQGFGPFHCPLDLSAFTHHGAVTLQPYSNPPE